MEQEYRQSSPDGGGRGNASGSVVFAAAFSVLLLGVTVVAYRRGRIALELMIAVLSLFATVAFALWHTRTHRSED